MYHPFLINLKVINRQIKASFTNSHIELTTNKLAVVNKTARPINYTNYEPQAPRRQRRERKTDSQPTEEKTKPSLEARKHVQHDCAAET